MIECMAHHQRHLVGEGGLEIGQIGLAHADQWRVDRLVRAALRPEREPGRRADEQEARILVTAIIERIEPARDERIVDRADRQQPRAEQRRCQAERGQHQEEIILGDAQFDMLACIMPRPFLGRGILRGVEHVGQFLSAEQPALIDERAEIGRLVTSGAVVTIRSASGSPDLARSSRIRPKAAWVDCSIAVGRGDPVRNRHGRDVRRGLARPAAAASTKGLECRGGIVAEPAIGLPLLPLRRCSGSRSA
jgi:hypothetical protein